MNYGSQYLKHNFCREGLGKAAGAGRRVGRSQSKLFWRPLGQLMGSSEHLERGRKRGDEGPEGFTGRAKECG